MTAFAATAADYAILQYNQELTCLSIEVIFFSVLSPPASLTQKVIVTCI